MGTSMGTLDGDAVGRVAIGVAISVSIGMTIRVSVVGWSRQRLRLLLNEHVSRFHIQ